MRDRWKFISIVSLGLVLAPGILLFGADDSGRDRLSFDTTANYLAGLTVPAGSAETPERDGPWTVHSRELDRAWKRTDQQQLPAIERWVPDFIGSPSQGAGTMFYMFSGPDFLYAHAFFENARTYILCGTEPIGEIPNLRAIPPQDLPATLANLRNSLESVLNWSFFITKNMKGDLTRTQLSGTLPILYVFLARSGCTINSVGLVALDHYGDIIENAKGEHAQSGTARVDGSATRVAGASGGNASDQTPGVRISITNSSGLSQTVYYFCTDLSDDGIKSKPGFLRFCESQGHGVSLLKAASYLMHESGFSQVRDFLLARSDVLIQDDSGIPLRFFGEDNWSLRYCGRYVGPIKVFTKYWQPDLAEAYARVAPSPLPFSFGYQWQPNRSDLLIAARLETNSLARSNDRRADSAF
jgi:hypothetical protein